MVYRRVWFSFLHCGNVALFIGGVINGKDIPWNIIFVVILGIVMGLAGKKFDGYVYTNTEPRSNTECTLTQRVFDDADVLTDEEEAKLEKLIAEKEKLIGGDIVLMTTNDASLNTMEKLRDYAQNYYKENKIGWDKPIGSGAIYVDDWETKHTWLATRGTVKDKLPKTIQIILWMKLMIL